MLRSYRSLLANFSLHTYLFLLMIALPFSLIGQEALLIANLNNNSLNSSDEQIKTELENAGFSVVVKDDDAVSSGDANGKELIWITDVGGSGSLAAQFKNSNVPIVLCDPALMDDFDLVANGQSGTASGNQISISLSNHMIANGNGGNVEIYSGSNAINWGIPNSKAQIVATIPGNSNHAGIFGYEAGVEMEGIDASARRLGMFVGDLAGNVLNANGREIIRVAAKWTAGISDGVNTEPTTSTFVKRFNPGTESHYSLLLKNSNGQFALIGPSGNTTANQQSANSTNQNTANADYDFHYLNINSGGAIENNFRYRTSNSAENTEERANLHTAAINSTGEIFVSVQDQIAANPVLMKITSSGEVVYHIDINQGFLPGAMAPNGNDDLLYAVTRYYDVANSSFSWIMNVEDDGSYPYKYRLLNFRATDWIYYNSSNSFIQGASVDVNGANYKHLMIRNVDPSVLSSNTANEIDLVTTRVAYKLTNNQDILGHSLDKLSNGNIVSTGVIDPPNDGSPTPSNAYAFWSVLNTQLSIQQSIKFRFDDQIPNDGIELMNGTQALEVKALDNGGFVVVGAVKTTQGDRPFLAKWDANNSFVFGKVYEFQGLNATDHYSFYQVEEINNGFLLGGGKFHIKDDPTASRFPGLVVRVDENGILAGEYECNFESLSVETESISFINDESISYANASAAGNASPIVANKESHSVSPLTASSCPPSQNLDPVSQFHYTIDGLTAYVSGGPSYDPEGSELTYHWEFEGHGTGTGINTSKTFNGPGSYYIHLTVTDDQGNTHTSSQAVEVQNSNLPPNAAFSWEQDDNNPLEVDFNASASSDSDGTIENYAWTFGDGNSKPNDDDPYTSHSFNGYGSYTVSLTVTDDDGETDQVSHEVELTDPNLISEVWLEAECGDVSENSHWANYTDNNPSGDHALLASVNDPNIFGDPNEGADYIVSFPFSIEVSGNYEVYARILAPNGDDDSYWARVNNESWAKWNGMPTGNSFSWHQVYDQDNNNNPVSYNLSAGAHTLQFHIREDGAVLDKVFISLNGSLPNGTGGIAESCTPTNPENNPPVLDPIVDQSNEINSPVSLALSASDPDGDNLSFIANGLPAGLSIDPNTGFISGTLTAGVGTYAVSITVNDDGNPILSDTENFDWIITDPNVAEEIWLEAECATVGNNWTELNDALAGGDRAIVFAGNDQTGGASGNPDDEVSFNFSLSSTGSYSLYARLKFVSNGNSVWVKVDNGSFFQLTSSANNSYSWYQIGQATVLHPGVHTITFSGRENDAVLDKIHLGLNTPTPTEEGEADSNCIFSPSNQPPVIEPITERTDEINAEINLQVEATDPDPGDILTYSASGLPPGLSINPNTGLISGTLTQIGDFNVLVSVSDDGDPILSDQKAFLWHVIDPGADDEFWEEVECQIVGSNWTEISDTEASGGLASQYTGANHLQAPSGNINDQVIFDLNISTPGWYQLFARVKFAQGDNSFWIEIGDDAPFKMDVSDFSGYTWHELTSKELTAGPLSITFHGREDDAILDKIHLVRGGSLPSGLGESDPDCEEEIFLPPVAVIDLSSTNVELGESISFTGSGSYDRDEEGASIVSYLWDLGNGNSNSNANFVHSYAQTGNYTISLTVIDDEGETAQASETITVNDPIPNDDPPVAQLVANPNEGNPPLDVLLDASGSYDDNGIVSYQWDFGDGTTDITTSPTTTHRYGLGVFTASVTVVDVSDQTAQASAIITVTTPTGEGAPPVAVITPQNWNLAAPQVFVFDGSTSYDPDGFELVRYEWIFEGETYAGANFDQLSVSIPNPGSYELELRVYDIEGLMGSTNISFELAEPSSIPEGEILYLYGPNNNGNIKTGDKNIRDHLISLGYSVFMRDYNFYSDTDLTGKILVMVSNTAKNGSQLNSIIVSNLPILSYDNGFNKNYGISEPVGKIAAQTELTISDPSHYMAAGVTGTQSIFLAPKNLFFGQPGIEAVVVARQHLPIDFNWNLVSIDGSNAAAAPQPEGLPLIYGYEKGRKLGDNTDAHARRVGFFLQHSAFNELTDTGIQLFNEAVCWALGCDIVPPYLCQEVPVSADDGTPFPSTGVPAANASGNKNYILSTTHRGSRPDWQSVAYFDGLGRNIQSIEVAASPKGASMVSPTVYDEFGRVPRQYMPIGMGGNGAFQDGAEGASGGFYHAGNFPYFKGADMGVPYGDTDYEASPLNRVLEQGAPGVDWQLGNHSVKTEYQSGSFTPGIGPTHTELSIIKTIDENGNYSLGAVDKLGRTVYQENELEEGPARTVYAYDDFGNVTHVIQPEANNTHNPLYTFTYSYDHRQRVIAKHIPGQEGETEIAYDDLDRVIATKDPNGTILVTQYDAFSRPIITGYGDMQGNLSGQPLTRTFYDEYGDEAHPFAGGIPLPAFGSQALVMPTPFSTQKFKGKVTTVLVKVLPAGAYLKTTTYYDDYGREIQTTADNHLGGKDISTNIFNFAGELLANVLIHEGPDGTVTIKKTFDYDHRGRLLRIIQQVDDTDPEIIGTYAYDELGQQTAKKLHATSCTDNLQTVDYTYNIRGWMTGINNTQIAGDFELDLECNTGEPQDLFGMKLLYNDNFLGGQALYNGNIAGMQWQNASNCFGKKAYGFNYDKLNRIKIANYGETTTGSLSYTPVANKYNLSLDYDKNGNISTLQRYGLIGSELFGIMDDLSYTYSGNRLTNIKDVGPSSPVILDGIEWTDQFLGGGGNLSYDANGNITADHRRTGISYNHLNKPTSVFVSGGNINWTYAADGSKLKEVVSGGTQPITRDYVAGFIYENNQLQYFPHEEGRAVKMDGAWQYQYNLTDHLGNVRVTFTDANEDGIVDPLDHEELLQENHYYPFGLRMGGVLNGDEEAIAETVPEQRMRYNGKELHTELGLGWVDYGFRWYEPSLGRFLSVDPLAEKFKHISSFQYASNDPILNIDLDGLEKLNSQTGEIENVSPDQNVSSGLDEQGDIMNGLGESTSTTTDENASRGLSISFPTKIGSGLFFFMSIGIGDNSKGADIPLERREKMWREAKEKRDGVEYFYRAMRYSEFTKTKGHLKQRVDKRGNPKGEGPSITDRFDYLASPNSFINKGSNKRKYDIIVIYSVNPGTREALNNNSIPEGEGSTERARRTNEVIIKEERGGFNYRFPGGSGDYNFNCRIKCIEWVPIKRN